MIELSVNDVLWSVSREKWKAVEIGDQITDESIEEINDLNIVGDEADVQRTVEA